MPIVVDCGIVSARPCGRGSVTAGAGRRRCRWPIVRVPRPTALGGAPEPQDRDRRPGCARRGGRPRRLSVGLERLRCGGHRVVFQVLGRDPVIHRIGLRGCRNLDSAGALADRRLMRHGWDAANVVRCDLANPDDARSVAVI